MSLTLRASLSSIPKLRNLKHLEIIIATSKDCFLDCPLLYKLKVKSTLHLLSPYELKIKKNNLPPSLRVAKFIGFQMYRDDIEFRMDLLESAELLEKVIDTCDNYFLGRRREEFYRKTMLCQSARKLAIELASRFPQLEFVHDTLIFINFIYFFYS